VAVWPERQRPLHAQSWSGQSSKGRTRAGREVQRTTPAEDADPPHNGERRGPANQQEKDQPVNFGPPLPSILGRATMKLVERTIFRISSLGFASSKGLAAGRTPKR
jgi:hypothetical protein